MNTRTLYNSQHVSVGNHVFVLFGLCVQITLTARLKWSCPNLIDMIYFKKVQPVYCHHISRFLFDEGPARGLRLGIG